MDQIEDFIGPKMARGLVFGKHCSNALKSFKLQTHFRVLLNEASYPLTR